MNGFIILLHLIFKWIVIYFHGNSAYNWGIFFFQTFYWVSEQYQTSVWTVWEQALDGCVVDALFLPTLGPREPLDRGSPSPCETTGNQNKDILHLHQQFTLRTEGQPCKCLCSRAGIQTGIRNLYELHCSVPTVWTARLQYSLQHFKWFLCTDVDWWRHTLENNLDPNWGDILHRSDDIMTSVVCRY